MATIPRLWFAPTLSAANNAIEFSARANSLGAGAPNAYSGTEAAGTYAEPHPAVAGSLLAVLATSWAAATRAGPTAFSADSGTVTITLSSAGIVTVTLGGLLDGSTATLHWATGGADAVALAALLGYDSSADDTAVVAGNVAAFVADWPMRNLWHPSAPPRVQAEEPADSWVSVSMTADGSHVTWYWQSFTRRRLVFEFVSAARARANAATGDDTNLDLETLWLSAQVARIRYWADQTAVESGGTSTYEGDYFLEEDAARRYEPTRYSEAMAFYTIEMPMRAFV